MISFVLLWRLLCQIPFAGPLTLLPVVLPSRKFTENQKVSGASQEMHPLKELAEPEQVGILDKTAVGCMVRKQLSLQSTHMTLQQ